MTPWTVACQAPLSMGFSRQEYWSGVPLPSPNILHSNSNTLVLDNSNIKYSITSELIEMKAIMAIELILNLILAIGISISKTTSLS